MKNPVMVLLWLTLLALVAGFAWVPPDEAPPPSGIYRTEPALLYTLIEGAVISMEGAGTLVIVGGAVLATAAFLRRLLRKEAFIEAYQHFRGNLGRAILLGLEFLVGADIIRTVAIAPTFSSLGVLGLIVLIRTFLSFSLEVEINGHWPWKESEINRQIVKP